MFLTHADDVADHARYAKAFGCTRVMHQADVSESTRVVERQLTGQDPHPLDHDLLVIPTPGHTAGSTSLLFNDAVLFTGDHLAYSRSLGNVYAFADACWFDWRVQIESVARLLDHRFSHIFPGHGAPCQFGPGEMRLQLENCLAWMREVGADR
jgi:glyoxylase-like metal-dependent hydrolase (beta-lactamase superfamily II)